MTCVRLGARSRASAFRKAGGGIGQIGAVWEPFFSGDAGKNGTEFIITSDVSRAWPIADAGLGADEKPGFSAPFTSQIIAAVRGVTAPWTLVASCALGAWLMFSRVIFGTEGVLANSDHLVGALIITVAVCAMAEVARPLRFLNVAFGLWLIAAPWPLVAAPAGATWNDIIAGLLTISLSLPRGAEAQTITAHGIGMSSNDASILLITTSVVPLQGGIAT